MKGLRGTAFDLFGRTAERRMERQLRDDYEALVDEVAAGLTKANLAAARDLLAFSETVRGFGGTALWVAAEEGHAGVGRELKADSSAQTTRASSDAGPVCCSNLRVVEG